ncbi:MAG TPA: ubiquinol-cytochrome c reductase iron-sulfur subunit [Acidobacteriota bacterium]|jgi:menaquinol-cytochrome c reductase iron-sulfur subunit
MNKPDSANSRRGFLEIIFWMLSALLAGLLSTVTLGGILSPIFRKQRSLAQELDLGGMQQYSENVPVAKQVEVLLQDGWNQQRQESRFYVVRTGSSAVVLSPVCTHLGCQVEWDAKDQKFRCPCHGGIYNISGQVVGGPPPRPLEQIPAEVRDNKLFIRPV